MNESKAEEGYGHCGGRTEFVTDNIDLSVFVVLTENDETWKGGQGDNIGNVRSASSILQKREAWFQFYRKGKLGAHRGSHCWSRRLTIIARRGPQDPGDCNERDQSTKHVN